VIICIDIDRYHRIRKTMILREQEY
jgi:hypothetical protein